MRLFVLLCVFPLGLVAQVAAPALDNEYVRVVMVTDKPVDEAEPLHEHKNNRVMVYLDPGDIRIKHADGKKENQHWKPGDVMWSPAGGIHSSQNISGRTIRIIEIELKSEGKASAADAPDRTRAVIDNAQVRVYQASKPPVNRHYVAVNIKTAEVVWDKLPAGQGPFVIAEVK